MVKLVYLASPYSGTKEQINNRIQQTKEFVVSRLNKKDEILYSPILHSHYIAVEYNLPRDFEFWKWRDFEMIKRCDEVYTLHLDGWKQSIGVQSELEFAKKIKKPIRHFWMPLKIESN